MEKEAQILASFTVVIAHYSCHDILGHYFVVDEENLDIQLVFFSDHTVNWHTCLRTKDIIVSQYLLQS